MVALVLASASLLFGCGARPTISERLELPTRHFEQVAVDTAIVTVAEDGARQSVFIDWNIQNKSAKTLCVPEIYEPTVAPMRGVIWLDNGQDRFETFGQIVQFPNDAWDKYIMIPPGMSRILTYRGIPTTDARKPLRLKYTLIFFECELFETIGLPTIKDILDQEIQRFSSAGSVYRISMESVRVESIHKSATDK